MNESKLLIINFSKFKIKEKRKSLTMYFLIISTVLTESLGISLIIKLLVYLLLFTKAFK